MPAYLVTLPEDHPGLSNILEGDSMVVFAADAADALAIADAQYDADSNLFSAVGTATEITAGADLDGWSIHIRIYDADPLIDVEVGVDTAAGLGANAVAIDGGGTGYTQGDILTVGGGTATRACTLRVTSVNTGVVDGIEVVDPGEYSALPSNPVSVTGGTGGDDATFNLTSNGGDDLTALLAQAVTLLNADAQIAGAAIDIGEGGVGSSDLTFTVASGGGGDDLGDKNMVVEVRKNGVALPSMVGAVTDGGAASAALSFAIPAVASRVNPRMLDVLRSV